MIGWIKARNKFHLDILKVFSGNVLGKLIGVITLPIVTRIYAPELYGEYSIYVQMIIAISVLLTFRYEHLLLVSYSHASAVRNLKSIMLIGLFGFMVYPVVILYNQAVIQEHYPVALDNYVVMLLVTSGFLMCIGYGLELNLQKNEVFFRSTLGEAFNKAFFILIAMACAYTTFKKYGLLFAFMSGALAKVLYLLWVSKFNIFKDKQKLSFKELKGFSKRSFALVYSHLLLVSVYVLPLKYISENFGANTLGQFSLVLTTLELVVALGAQSMSNVYFQRMTSTTTHQGKLDLWNKTIKLSTMLALPIFALIYITSGWGYQFVFGQEWDEAGLLARILLFSSLFAFISRPMESTSLVLNIWWYSPLWHTFRFVLMYLLFDYASVHNIPLEQSMWYYVFMMVVTYSVDIIVQRILLAKSEQSNG